MSPEEGNIPMRSTSNLGCGAEDEGGVPYVRNQAINPLSRSVSFGSKTILPGAKESSDV